MNAEVLKSFAAGEWVAPQEGVRELRSAVTGDIIAFSASHGLDYSAMLDYARNVGGPALRALTFHQRASMIKALAVKLGEAKDRLYDLSYETGATKADSWIDIDGGIGTMFVYASKGKRELPDDTIYIDGAVEQLSRGGTFLGRHVATPLQGVALHINAFNFPVWGMLEKLAPTLLAGVPAIVKPATATSYLAQAAFQVMMDANILPPGAIQMIAGGAGSIMDHLTCQDVVSFTGSAQTAMTLQAHPVLARESVRFIAERDSLNATILGPDAGPGTPEFDLLVKEVIKEMTAKAGQKCTAIRRIIVPQAHEAAVIEAVSNELAQIRIGNPREKATKMGALASLSQRLDVREKAALLAKDNELVFGDLNAVAADGVDVNRGAFVSPLLFRCPDPWRVDSAHDVEAFGPVATIMGYRDVDDAVALANRGQGSLVVSAFTHDPVVARDLTMGSAAFHGRMVFIDRDCAAESTGHGSPLPHMTHGGPGRAGGGEEMGGIRGVMHYMQRTALQGSPRMLSAITNEWVKGAQELTGSAHPFRHSFEKLELGETFHSEPRVISLEDIEHFAHFTGDTFYAHMDEEAASANPFFPGRVAHGYLLISFAAGLFVDPAPGPVLANYGLDNLRFLKPVSPGDSIKVRLTVKSKKARNEDYGEVRWDVELTNQDGDIAAQYELLTMNAREGR